jgi:HNH endonuclease
MPRKPIPGYYGLYEADTEGGIWRHLGGGFFRRLRGTPLNGYVQVSLSVNGVRTACYAHRLIALTFLGPPAPGMQVNHRNRNKQDNRLSNLEYKTPKEHSQHTRSTGYRAARGEGHTMSILNNRTVLLIRKAANQHIPPARIARILGVSASAIYHVVARTRWTHVENEAAPAG